MNSKRISENNKRVMVGAFLTILIPLLIGAIYILSANDGSIPENSLSRRGKKIGANIW